jgi:hypothetical protein
MHFDSHTFQTHNSSLNPALNTLFVVGAGPLNDLDQGVKTRLEGMGYEVTLRKDRQLTPQDTQGQDLVLISESVFSYHIGNSLNATPVPILTWESWLYDDLGLTGTQVGQDFGLAPKQTQVSVVADDSLLAGGLTGEVEVYGKKDELRWGKPGDQALTIATLPGQGEKATIFAYDAGVTLADGTVAPARRVGFYWDADKASRLTEASWQLFDAAVTWATHQAVEPEPTTQAKLWGIDSHDSQLFSIGDYEKPETSLVNYGQLRVQVGNKTRKIKDISGFAIDTDNHTAYLAINRDAKGIDAPWIGRLDLNTVKEHGPNLVTVVGEVDLRYNNDPKAKITGLGIDPTSGKLYGLLNEQGSDDLLILDKTTGTIEHQFPSIWNRRTLVKDGGDLSFDGDGNLYLIDNQDQELYRVNKTTGRILETVDNRVEQGLGQRRLQIEGLAWDPVQGQLVFTETQRQQLGQLSLGHGHNTVLDRTKDLGLKRVEAIDFQVLAGDSEAPVLTLELVEDTGIDGSDGITNNPAIQGTVTDNREVATLSAQLNGHGLVDMTDLVQGDGGFRLDAAQLGSILGAPLADGTYSLNLRATDPTGNFSTATLDFVLDTSLTIDSFGLGSEFDTEPVGDNKTTEERVTLVGQTEAGATVVLQETGVTTTADNSGQFRFEQVALAYGQNDFTVVVTDLAGNQHTASQTVTLEDLVGPVITAGLGNDTGIDGEDGITRDPSITGTVTDNHRVVQLLAQLNGSGLVDVTPSLQPDGTFSLDLAQLATLNGGTNGGTLPDGEYGLELQALDPSGNRTAWELVFNLDTTNPTVNLGLTGTFSDTFQQFSFSHSELLAPSDPANYRLLALGETNTEIAITSIEPLSALVTQVNLSGALGDGDYRFEILDGSVTDLAGNFLAPQSTTFTVLDSPDITEISPVNGTEFVALTRPVVVRFSEAIDPATITNNSLEVRALGAAVAGRWVVSSTEAFAIFYPEQPWNPSTEVEIEVKGDLIVGRDGHALDANGDGTPGGRLTTSFRTVSNTPIEGTQVFGYVYDSFNQATDGANLPVVGATIRVDGLPGVTAVTDEHGYFELGDVPGPEFFVHIDSSTAVNAPAGTSYATVGKPFHPVPGQAIGLSHSGEPFDIYLPPMAQGDFQDLSATEATDVGFGAAGLAQLTALFPEVDPAVWSETQVRFLPGSAQDSSGVAATQASIIPVAPDRLPAPLPSNLDPRLVISIQAPGATVFDVPAPITFPNLEGLAPGEKSLIVSFNHDSGKWEVVGSGTVSGDGRMINSDPGVGILAPGWHLTIPGVEVKGGELFDEEDLPKAFFKSLDSSDDDFNQVNIVLRAFIPAPVAGLTPDQLIFDPPGFLDSARQYPDFIEELTELGLSTSIPSIIGDLTKGAEVAIEALKDALTQSGATEGEVEAAELKFREILRNGSDLQDFFPPLIKGDGLTFGNPGGSYRALQTITVTAEPGDPIVTDFVGDWGPSALYFGSDGFRPSGQPFWFRNLNNGAAPFATSELTTLDTNNRATVTRKGNVVSTNFFLDGSLPLLPAPTLSAAITVDIKQNPGQPYEYRIRGSHDGFPAYELYLDNTLVYSYNPIEAGESPFDLFSPLDKPVFTSFTPNISTAAFSLTRTSTESVSFSASGFGNEVLETAAPETPEQAEPALIPQSGTHHYVIQELVSKEVVLRGSSQGGVALSDGVVLAPDTAYRITVLQPETLKVGGFNFTTPGSNGRASLSLDSTNFEDFLNPQAFTIDSFLNRFDSDDDGLGNLAELVLGTDIANSDTDGDGISDLAEFEQGLNPLDGQSVATGIIASLPLPGNAQSLIIEGDPTNSSRQTAYIATGNHGLALADLSQPDSPILLGQLDLPGNAIDIALDPTLQIAALATTNTLELVDVSNPNQPSLRHSLNLNAQQVEILDGILYATVGDTIHTLDLITGQTLNTLNLSGSGTITDLFRNQTQLYSYTNGSDTFSILDISDSQSPSLTSQLTVPIASDQVGIFAADGVAYLAGSGLRTLDISDPNTPNLISNADFFFTARDLALNGSGLAAIAAEDQGIGLFDITDPTNTNNLRTTFNTPGFANDIVIASGIAYVADSSSGLQVINYLPFDNQGQAPTVTLQADHLDLDPTTEGIQVNEGSTLNLNLNLTDDVQVRNVELLVNGEVVRNDVSFPFDLSAIAPNRSQDATTATLQIRATDTGGNQTLSNPLTLNLLPDTTAPTILKITPGEDATSAEGPQVVQIRFSEALSLETVNLETFQLLDVNGAPMIPANLQIRSNNQWVQLTFDFLARGEYQLQIDAVAVTDRAKNSLGTELLTSRFTLIAETRTGNNPVDLALADLNQDGHLDVITANQDSNTLSVLLGLGNGEFAPGVEYGVGTMPSRVQLADLDNDGDLDVVATNFGENTLSILLGDGTGQFSLGQTLGDVGPSAALGDLDGDGDLDIADLGSGDDLSIRLNQGNGTFATPLLQDLSNNLNELLIADFNDDGIGDLVTLDESENQVAIWLGQGDGTFAVSTTLNSNQPVAAALGDLDGDGDIDLADLGSGEVSIYLNSGNGNLTEVNHYNVDQGSESMSLGDVNGDGHLDLVTLNPSRNQVTSWLGDGNGNFTSTPILPLDGVLTALALGDLDGDGQDDILVTDGQADRVIVQLS